MKKFDKKQFTSNDKICLTLIHDGAKEVSPELIDDMLNSIAMVAKINGFEIPLSGNFEQYRAAFRRTEEHELKIKGGGK